MAWARMAEARPIVASYRVEDPTLKGGTDQHERAFTGHGIPHGVKECPGAGHGFLDDHEPQDSNWVFNIFELAVEHPL